MDSTNTAFEMQARRIEHLEERIRKARGRKEELGRRLGGVRERVEGVVGREAEGERRVGRRLRWLLWGGVGGWVVLGLVMAGVRGRVRGEGRDGGEVEVGWGMGGCSKVRVGGNGSLEGVVNVSLGCGKDLSWEGEGGEKVRGTATKSVTTSAAPRGSSVDAEATLRLFDEL